MNRNDLVRIAADMKADLSTETKVERMLGRVLLRLRRDDHRFVLDVARSDVMPDYYDGAAIAAAFDAPTDEPVPVQFRVYDNKGQSVPVKALRYTWIETVC